MIKFAIVSTPTAFAIVEIQESELGKYDNVVWAYETEACAVIALARSQRLEQELRPLWLAAVENERHVKNLMLSAVYKAAKPL